MDFQRLQTVLQNRSWQRLALVATTGPIQH